MLVVSGVEPEQARCRRWKFGFLRDGTMSKRRRDKVEEAIKEIRAFYSLGKELRRANPRGRGFDRHFISAEALRQKTNEDRLRKARAFADRVAGYSRNELSELCRLIREVQPDQDDRLGIFGPALIMRLLSVPKNDRRALQKQAVEGGWTFSRLDREIARRYGPRREGGRRPRILGDMAGFLAQVESMCLQWFRWREELSREPQKDEERHVMFADLSPTLKDKITTALVGIKGLHGAVAKALKQKEPGRIPRELFQEEEQAASSKQNGKRRTGRN